MKEANNYKSRDCNHGGKLACWPPFSTRESSVEEFLTLDGENDLIRKELKCFHTKLPFTDNQLGLGLKISKIPRTGNIREAETFYDYISIKAFLKESVNMTSTNERMTHWMPVYFGNGDNASRFFHFLKKSISMIMTNNTKNFHEEQVLEVLPKLLITIIYHLMDEKKHPSIRAIRLVSHIHSIFLYCLKEYPQLEEKIKQNLATFIKDEKARIKDVQSNLGAVLATLSVADSFKFSDVVEPYFEEQLDRHVLWILKAVPELITVLQEKDVDEAKVKIVFKSQMTSFHIFCFYKLWITEVCEKRKSRKLMLQEY